MLTRHDRPLRTGHPEPSADGFPSPQQIVGFTPDQQPMQIQSSVFEPEANFNPTRHP